MFLVTLFAIVVALFVFSLTKDKGKNTIHARQDSFSEQSEEMPGPAVPSQGIQKDLKRA